MKKGSLATCFAMTAGIMLFSTALTPAALAAGQYTESVFADLEHDRQVLDRMAAVASKVGEMSKENEGSRKDFCANILPAFFATGTLNGMGAALRKDYVKNTMASYVADVDRLVSDAKADACDSFALSSTVEDWGNKIEAAAVSLGDASYKMVEVIEGAKFDVGLASSGY